jgi:lipid-binding SYLF domain-containing protein
MMEIDIAPRMPAILQLTTGQHVLREASGCDFRIPERFKGAAMRRAFLTTLLLMNLSGTVWADLREKVSDRLWESSQIIDALVNTPEGALPKNLLERAECVAVIPRVKKFAFGFGGRYGRGAVSCRKDQGKGPWGPPSMIALGGASFGLQLGGQSTDLVMLFMTGDSIKYLLRDKVTLGGEVAAAVGPLGREASAETSASLSAEILSYSRSRGLFAGIALKGAVLRPDTDANKALYEKSVSPNDLLVEGNIAIPESAQKFVDMLKTTTGVAN